MKRLAWLLLFSLSAQAELNVCPRMPVATATSHNWVSAITAGGATTLSQPAFTDVSGSVAASQMPALTGDVTTSAGAVATTIGANKVANSQLAQMSANTIKCNNTAGTANALDCTTSQVNTLLGALSNPMTTGGDVIYGGSSGTPTRLANGTVGQHIQSAGGTSAPTWALNQVTVGSAQTSDGTSGSTSYANPTNQPVVTFTATATAKYRIYAAFPTFDAVAGSIDCFKVNNSSGSATVTYNQEMCYDTTSSGLRTPISIFMVASLTSGTSYTFGIQCKTSGGTCRLNSAIIGGGTALVAEQIE